MMRFGEFLRQRRPKTTKGVEQSSHQNLDPSNLIRIDDRHVSLRWRTRERVQVVHQVEA